MPNPVDLHLIFAATTSGEETPWIVGAWDAISIEMSPESYEADLQRHEDAQDRIAVVKTTIDMDLVDKAFRPELPVVATTPVEVVTR